MKAKFKFTVKFDKDIPDEDCYNALENLIEKIDESANKHMTIGSIKIDVKKTHEYE